MRREPRDRLPSYQAGFAHVFVSLVVSLSHLSCASPSRTPEFRSPPVPAPEDQFDSRRDPQVGQPSLHPQDAPPTRTPPARTPDRSPRCFFIKDDQLGNGLCTLGQGGCPDLRGRIEAALNAPESPFRGLFELGECVHVERAVTCFGLPQSNGRSVPICTPEAQFCPRVQQFLAQFTTADLGKCVTAP
jgi:hypothetical protein